VGNAKTAAGEIASSSNAVPIDDLKIMDRAATDLQDQIAKKPDDVSLHNRVALMYGSLGDFDAAAQHFQKAIDLSRAKIASIKQQEKAARQMFDYAEASRKLSEIANLNIELSAAHSSLARVYDQMGKHEKVVAQLDQLNSDIVFGAAPEAKKEVPALAEAVPESKPNDSKTMKSLALGQALMQAHRVPEAIQQFRNYLSLDPTSAFAHEHLGFAYSAVNDPASAAREFEAAVRLEPGKANYHNELGSALQTIGEADRAQAEYERVLALNPRDAEASFNLGTILSLRGQYDEALDAFRKAVQNNPRSPLAHNHLATMLSFKGDYRDAITEYQQALRLAPDLASSHYGLGLALYNLKEYPMSIRELKRALALNPNLVDAQSKIEIAYRKSGIAAIGRTN
jgi:tetratricopeptide (TPR) repeat protein